MPMDRLDPAARVADIILNGAIFAVTLFIVLRYVYRIAQNREGEKKKHLFRSFTCLSNMLCALTALATALAGLTGTIPEWVRMLKYIGTAGVTLTILTVFLFLAPSIGKGWQEILLQGVENTFMHLLTPLTALLTFCVFERNGMTFAQSLLGMVPIALYGPLYMYKVLLAPEGKRWDDFYHFIRNGKWGFALTAMVTGNFLICMGLMALQNL